MKLVGDVPQEHKDLAEALIQEEAYWNHKSSYHSGYGAEIIAKAFVCLAHDWYQIGDEEHGESLLLKAEQICPGYFKNLMLQQTYEDKDFDHLVKSLTGQLTWMLINRVKEMK